MSRIKTAALSAFVAVSVGGQVQAQSLRVYPVTIDLPPSSKSAFITVGAEGGEPVQVQARVFKWSLVNGEDKLEPTSEVVVSPPIFKAGKSENVVRIIRIGQSPVQNEETYRVVLNEILDRKKLQAGAVSLAISHSIPVFFHGFDLKAGTVAWDLSNRKGKLVLTATNSGQKRLKLSRLHVTDGAARNIISMDGLAGYVLGGQTKTWNLSLPASGMTAGTVLKVSAETEAGPINASIVVGKSG